MEQEKINNIYKNIHLDKIPWNIKTPPDIITDLVVSRKILPCRTVDLGCGTGNYSIYLARKGFDVTGIDFSPAAIDIAEKNAEKEGVSCSFLTADLLGDLGRMHDTFEFAYDWELLHHIFPEQRQKYVKNVYNILKPNGRYLSVCFSEKSPQFGGTGKYRKTPLDTTLYFSSEDELGYLFEPFFNINELKTIQVSGKNAPHMACYALMEKK